DLGDHLIDALGLDRPLAQCDLHRAQELVAIERHPPPVALDDDELAQLHTLERGEAEIAGETNAAAADDRGILRRSRVLDLSIKTSAARAAHRAPLLLVDRESAHQALDLIAHAGLDHSIFFRALLRKRIEDFGNHRAHLAEFGDTEAACGAGRRS